MPNESRSSPVVVDTSRSPYARVRPVPVTAVRLADCFWEPRRRTNRERTLPWQYRQAEESGSIDNFRRAAGKKDGPFQGMYYDDYYAYKWLEAASWTLAADPDPALARTVDGLIAEVSAAQRPDGYLNTYFARDRADERWTNVPDMHEMFLAGHLIQAGVVHHRATGSTRLLDSATRFADHICAIFGPAEQGKRPETDGHEEIELALVELYRATGERRYLDQARFFVDIRGHESLGRPYGRFDPEYHQDHQPFREMEEMVGHAVRAVYYNCGAADLYAETGEAALQNALHRLWANMTERKLYVSGGIGARYEGEAFGADYELPNERAYSETCAAIGSVMWNWRMLLAEGDGRYADLLETTLYNGVLPGVSLDGQAYFYQNPLADDGGLRRQPWFQCACCPPNVAQLIASIPGYFYGVSDGRIWVHLYAQGTAEIFLPGGAVRLDQRTRYPWDGRIEIEVDGRGTFGLFLRVPAWCEEGATIDVNGQEVARPRPGAYAEVRREWAPGDVVRLELPMPVRRVECHPYVAENVGRVALMRGPLLYCVEGADNPGLDPRHVVLPAAGEISHAYQPDLLGGVVALTFDATVAAPDRGWPRRLYCTAGAGAEEPRDGRVAVTAIPYLAWANREASPMQVWLRTSR